MVLLDEEDEGDDMDEEEEDLDIGTEIDTDSPPWDFLHHEPEIDDNDDSNEDTALLRSKAARTEIVITPISPVRVEIFMSFLQFLIFSFTFFSCR